MQRPDDRIPQAEWLDLIEQSGLNDSEAARLCGISPAAVCRYCSDDPRKRRQPPRWVAEILRSYVEAL